MSKVGNREGNVYSQRNVGLRRGLKLIVKFLPHDTKLHSTVVRAQTTEITERIKALTRILSKSLEIPKVIPLKVKKK